MEQVSLSAERREASGSGPARRLREEGGIPAVLYGRGLDSTSLTVTKRDLYSALHTDSGLNALINLEVGSDKYLTVARELQRHPVRGEIVHLAESVESAARQAREVLNQTGTVVSAVDAVAIDRLVQELSRAAVSIRVFADYLDRHPEALIRGKNR